MHAQTAEMFQEDVGARQVIEDVAGPSPMEFLGRVDSRGHRDDVRTREEGRFDISGGVPDQNDDGVLG
nr:hypothetical protein [Nocardiopsis sp. CNT312]